MRIRACLLAALSIAVLTTTTSADGPFDKFLPRGRLLKKLRDDVMGKPEPKEPTPAKRPNTTGQKSPTPAVRPDAHQRQQTPSTRNQGTQQHRAQANRSNQPKRPQMVNSGLNGFGMTVVDDRNNRVTVAQVVEKGNAAEAGLQRGDIITEAGGVELTSIEEYQEIAKMLGAGDQLELKVARRGQTGKVMLQYGRPPSLEDVEVDDMNTESNRSANQQRSSDSGNDFSFVPPADEDSRPGMRSVVERPIIPVRPASTQQQMQNQVGPNHSTAPPQQLQQTVSKQQQQIQMLQRRLEQLQRNQGLTGSGLRTRRSVR